MAAGRRVFIIEDRDEVRDALADVLRSNGYTVFTASDGVDAVARLAEAQADLLIVDLLMPRLDGEAFVRGLSGLGGARRDIKVLVVSGHPGGREIAKRMKADGYLAKPFDIDELLRKVAQLTGGRQRPPKALTN